MVERKLAETGQHTISWNLAWGTIVNPAGEFEAVAIPVDMQGEAELTRELLQAGQDSLVRGGRLDIGAERGENGLDIVVRAEGSRIVLDPELKKVLVGETSEDEVAPRAAAAWLVHLLVEEGGGRLQVSDEVENMLLIGASLPA